MRTVGSLFAGIGGFDLGFERAGFKTVWQVEKNAYCRRVLRRHFPDADRRVTDVRYAGARNLLPVDVICGGFPCQDISNAGLRAGIDGARSGLWFHMHRIIGELRPRFVVVENVAALLGRGMGRVLGDLSEIGYDAWWQVISAADVGAPHLRERIWILAYPNGEPASVNGADRLLDCQAGSNQGDGNQRQRIRNATDYCGADVADAARELPHGSGPAWRRRAEPSDRGEDASHAYGNDAQGVFSGRIDPEEWAEQGERSTGSRHAGYRGQWSVEPNVGRVAHGIPARVDRLRALGNAVVPQIPELIARRLQEVMA